MDVALKHTHTLWSGAMTRGHYHRSIHMSRQMRPSFCCSRTYNVIALMASYLLQFLRILLTSWPRGIHEPEVEVIPLCIVSLQTRLADSRVDVKSPAARGTGDRIIGRSIPVFAMSICLIPLLEESAYYH